MIYINNLALARIIHRDSYISVRKEQAPWDYRFAANFASSSTYQDVNLRWKEKTIPDKRIPNMYLLLKFIIHFVTDLMVVL